MFRQEVSELEMATGAEAMHKINGRFWASSIAGSAMQPTTRAYAIPDYSTHTWDPHTLE